MVELPLAVHHTHLPIAKVWVTKQLLCSGWVWMLIQFFWPDVLSIAVKLSEVKVSTVLASISIYEVTITMARSIVPLTSVLWDLVALNLDAIAVSDSQDLWNKFWINLADVLDDQGLDTVLVQDRQRIIAFLVRSTQSETDCRSLSTVSLSCTCLVTTTQRWATSQRWCFRLLGLFSFMKTC